MPGFKRDRHDGLSHERRGAADLGRSLNCLAGNLFADLGKSFNCSEESSTARKDVRSCALFCDVW